MEPRTRTALVLACAGLLVAPSAASAAPDRTGEITGAAPFAWDGGPVTGVFPVVFDDDDTLLTVKEAGKLTVVLSDADDTAADIDLYLYKSNAAGEPVGDPLVTGETGGSDEKVSKDIPAGTYLVRVSGFTAFEGTYKGKATLAVEAATPPATPPATTPDLLPEAKLGTLPKAKASKKLVLKGTAKDDKSVGAVHVAIVKKGKKCTQLSSSGKFVALAKCEGPTSFLKAKGTTSWSFTLKKGLPKGSYTVFARATDAAGQQQGGFSKANRKSLTVK